MKIRHFYIGLSIDDYLIENPPNSELPFRESDKGEIVSYINHQSDFFSHFIENNLRKLKYEALDFNMILIRGRKIPKELFYIEKHHKCLTVEDYFNEKEYRKLYSYENQYPLKGILRPVSEKEKFNEFLFSFVMKGLLKAKEQNAPIPVEELLIITKNFKSLKFRNEWIFKKKTFKEYGIKTSLHCELNCNHFSLKLIVEKGKKTIVRKEILKTLPSIAFYKGEFKDIMVENGKLKVLKEDKSILFETELKKNKNWC